MKQPHFIGSRKYSDNSEKSRKWLTKFLKALDTFEKQSRKAKFIAK